MKQLLRAGGLATAICCLAAGIQTVAAHHSTSMFDSTKTYTIKGTVRELRWVNPHATITVTGTVEGKEAQEPETWLLEMTSPGNLTRAGGWTRNAVKPGDQVVVQFNPLQNADNKGGSLKKLTLFSSGQVFTSNIREQERPGLE